MNLENISGFVSGEFQDIDKQVRAILNVFICGSHGDGDKQAIETLRDCIKNPEGEFRIPGTFIMQDIPVEGEDTLFNQKFEAIWKNIEKGSNIPICLMYAGETSGTSLGLNAEIQSVARNMERKYHTHLIRHTNASLNHFAEEFLPFHVSSVQEFQDLAKKIVRSRIHETKSMLQLGNNVKPIWRRFL